MRSLKWRLLIDKLSSTILFADQSGSNSLHLIKFPSKQLKRGRPKGAGLTVIGIPSKKKKGRKGPIAFPKKSRTQKNRGIMINDFAI